MSQIGFIPKAPFRPRYQGDYDVYANEPANLVRSGNVSTWYNPNPVARSSVRFVPDPATFDAQDMAFRAATAPMAEALVSGQQATPEMQARMQAFYRQPAQGETLQPRGRWIMGGAIPAGMKTAFLAAQGENDARLAAAGMDADLGMMQQENAARELALREREAEMLNQEKLAAREFARLQLQLGAPLKLLELGAYDSPEGMEGDAGILEGRRALLRQVMEAVNGMRQPVAAPPPPQPGGESVSQIATDWLRATQPHLAPTEDMSIAAALQALKPPEPKNPEELAVEWLNQVRAGAPEIPGADPRELAPSMRQRVLGQRAY